MKDITVQFLQVIIVVFSVVNVAIAQPEIEWIKTYGGSDSDIGDAVTQTVDGGYIAVGATNSDDIDVGGHIGFEDWWVVKVDVTGNLQWEKCFGTLDSERARDVKGTPDNGCIIIGYISDDGSNSNHNGIRDYCLIKLDPQGEVEWQGYYGSTASEFGHTISLTSDGGYIIAGSRSIFKLDASGNIDWEKNYGGSKSDVILSIEETSDLGYVAAGYSKSDDGDIGMNNGEEDVWVMKLNVDGELEWSNAYGGSGEDEARSVQQSDDGGYIVGAYTDSSDGDIENNYGDEDFWILRLDAHGVLEWEKSFGGQKEDKCQSLQKISNDKYIVSGWTRSSDVDVTNNSGLLDIWVFQIDKNGNLEWEKNYGGGHIDQCLDIKETKDGGLVATGNTYSDDDFGGQGFGSGDLWIMKLSPLAVGLVESNEKLKISVYPNPNTGAFTINTSKINTFVDVKIFDLNGKVVFERKNVDQAISIDYLSSGVYFLSVSSENNSYIKKIIVGNN